MTVHKPQNTKGKKPEPMTQPLLSDEDAARLARQYGVRPRNTQSVAQSMHRIWDRMNGPQDLGPQEQDLD
jgi:hypothetical protein